MVKIKDLPKIDRPREKLEKKGVSALKKVELLAILLRVGIAKKNVIQVAKDILNKYGGKRLIDASYNELRNIHGVGPTKAAQILAAIELGKRLYKEKIENDVYIHTTGDVLREVSYLRGNKRENFILLCLDVRKKLIFKDTVSIGTLDATLVHPREVFEPAVKCLAAKIIVAHNHPSGDPKPSKEDILITENLVRSGKILGVGVVDHLIVGNKDYFSFKEKGMIDGQ